MNIKQITKIMVGCALLVLFAFMGYWYMFRDMARLPHGELIASYNSPTKEYTLNVYLCHGGATVDNSIRGELETKYHKRNIFWQYKEDCAEVEWVDDHHISINGIILDIRYDIYDWRSS